MLSSIVLGLATISYPQTLPLPDQVTWAVPSTAWQETYCQSKSQGNQTYVKNGVCWVETDNACNQNAVVSCSDYVDEKAPLLVCYCQG